MTVSQSDQITCAPLAADQEIALEPIGPSSNDSESFQFEAVDPSLLQAQNALTPTDDLDDHIRGGLRAVACGAGLFFGLVSLYTIFAPVLGEELAPASFGATSFFSLAIAGLLFSRRPLSNRQLRSIEYLFFGLLTLCILGSTYWIGSDLIARGDLAAAVACEKKAVFEIVVLLIAYGALIPNDPKPAARFVLTMALGPLVVVASLTTHRADAGTILNASFASEIVVWNAAFVILGAVMAVFAAHVQNGLRKELASARSLGQYRLLEKLGSGTIGDVYLAEHQLLKRPCALKLITADLGKDLPRFEAQVQTAATLNHPNTIRIYDYWHTRDGRFYYVMEYLAGLNLADVVGQFGALPPARAVYLAGQVCKALAETHRLGLAHRGLEPSKIFVAIQGGECDVAKVLDVRLATIAAEADGPSLSAARKVARGAPYQAPESAGGGELGVQSDIYSLGAILSFMLTGAPPPEEAMPIAPPVKRPPESTETVWEVAPGVPDDLAAIVRRCLAKAPSDWFPDASSLAAALAGCGCAPDWHESLAEKCWRQQADNELSQQVDDVVPKRFGRYIVQEPFGEGGMGTVYRAFDTTLEVPVALKIPRRFKTSETSQRDLFLAEARALARLHHPHLCRIFDTGEIDGRLYISMGLVEGKPLSWSADRSPRQVVDLIRTAALALEEAHAIGVIHRDLKPANILLNRQGQPIVVDFGLAIRTSDSEWLRAQRGQIAGTLAYLSPEQIEGEPTKIGPPSDVYNLGVVLYELLTGRPPFGENQQLTLHSVLSHRWQAADPPSKHGSGVDAALDAVCLRAIEKDLFRRFPSMRDFASALEEYLARAPSEQLVVDSVAIRYDFVGVEQTAPHQLEYQDCLYLDAGNRLGVGAIDHRSSESRFRSTTSGLLASPELIRRTLKPWRRPDSPFTISMHESPDLDCIAATYLAEQLLSQGAFPEGAAELAAYVDGVASGTIGFSPDNRYSLYAALMQLGHRTGLRGWERPADGWNELVRQGKQLVAYVLKSAVASKSDLAAIDAFKTPGVLGVIDRRDVDADFERYERKLADPGCRARAIRACLPTFTGARREVEFLLVRNVQDSEDADRCIFFKDWARSDRKRCPNSDGYPGLCVVSRAASDGLARCILSVRPESGISLQDLAARLEAAESASRRARSGVDDRAIDQRTGTKRPPRPGYDNADPWYDGRSHQYTIIASPKSGTVLTLDEIEGILSPEAAVGQCSNGP